MEKQTTVEFLARFPKVLGKSDTTSSQEPILIKADMTPKEKADELFTHYHNLIQSIGGELGQEILVSILAKQSALFAAREVLKEKWNIEVEGSEDEYYWWEEVEHEIESI